MPARLVELSQRVADFDQRIRGDALTRARDLVEGVRSGRFRTEGGAVGTGYVGGAVPPDPVDDDLPPGGAGCASRL